MKAIATVPLESGDSIAIEVEDTEDTAIVRASRSPDALAVQAFEAALERLRPAAEAIVNNLRLLSQTPDEIGVEFGIKVMADAGLVVARTSGEANFKVTLQWRRP
jgi:NTP-dependent ternary system trypsin peptidase co-occuring protein